MKCDLHLHSTFSDGTLTPEQLVDEQYKRGMDCIAVCDHDTVAGVEHAVKHAEAKLQVIPSVELSTFCDREVHVLGYNVAYKDSDFLKEMNTVANYREERNAQMAAKLREYGFDVHLDRIKERKKSVIGRADFAEELIKTGAVKNRKEAFDKYIGKDKCCYVKSKRLTVTEAIQLCLRYGGFPVLAHPKSLRFQTKQQFEDFLETLVKAGLAGIEALYFSHNIFERKYYSRQAQKHGLIITGGSDYHSREHGTPLGNSFNPSKYTKMILGIK